MKAFVHEFGKLSVKTMPDPVAGDGEVVLALKTAGLNHRDLFIPDRRGDQEPSLIIGSDGAGVIESIGNGVERFAVGDEVIINPGLRWYENSIAPPKEFDILGMPDNGTIAEKIVLSAEQIEKKPVYLSWDEAGVLALSGLTGYRALFTKGDIKAGETVFIPGASGGVATYMIAFAKSAGARVITTSRSAEKRKLALAAGADVVMDTAENWPEKLNGETADLVIESIGKATFNRSMKMLKKGGRIVVFGSSTADIIELNLREFFYGQYQLFGTTMGSREELRDMLQFAEKHGIRPVIAKKFALEQTADAMTFLKDGKQFGNIVIDVTVK